MTLLSGMERNYQRNGPDVAGQWLSNSIFVTAPAVHDSDYTAVVWQCNFLNAGIGFSAELGSWHNNVVSPRKR